MKKLQLMLFCDIKSDNVFVFHPIRYSNVARKKTSP